MSVITKKIPYEFKNPSLLDNRAFVGGKWIHASDGKTFTVLDPEDNAVAAEVADLTREDVNNAISVAHEAFLKYKKTPHRQRRWLMRKWSDEIKANRDDLAAICTLELGKPFTDSLGAVDYGTSFLDWFETEIEKTYGETIPAARPGNLIVTTREPQGVVGAITPWNSPIAMVTRKVGAAIAAGNTVVLKPAPETPLCAIAIAKLFEKAGYEPGILNIVTSSAENTPRVGEEFTTNKLVRHLSFTGSTPVGKMLASECGKQLKRISMELGGNAPFIVFEDANIPKAVAGLVTSKFRSSGQTCVCANRIFVHRSIISKFASELEKAIEKTFTLGSNWDRKVNFGPLYSAKGIEKVDRHVAEAVKLGAKVVVGGKIDKDRGPNFFLPTILIEASTSMPFATEETFGPVAALIPFDTEEEVLASANDTEMGLASYFYTEDISRMWRVAEALQSGMVGARVGMVSAAEQPFGGIKESGVGREGSKFALEEYCNIKSVTIGV